MSENMLRCGEFFYRLDGDGTAVITGCTLPDGAAIDIPGELDGHPVTAIASRAFELLPGDADPLPDPYEPRRADIITELPGAGDVPVILTIPESVKRIGCNAFARRRLPGKVIINGSNTDIGDFAFAGCMRIKAVEIKGDDVSLGEEAFVLCTALVSAVFSGTGTVIGNRAFQCCEALRGLDLHGVKALGDQAFGKCPALNGVKLPGTLESAGVNPFSQDARLTDLTLDPANRCFTLDDGMLISNADNRLVLVRSLPGTVSLALPDTLASIGGYVFTFAPDLKQLTLPAGVTDVDRHAFLGISLKSAVLAPGTKAVCADTFGGQRELESVVIPESVTEIGEDAFEYCHELKSITLPAALTSIGSHAFALCGALTSICIPESVERIGSNPFASCRNLPGFELSPSNTHFELVNGALIDTAARRLIACPSALRLGTFIVPDGITEIGAYAFDNCEFIRRIALPESVTAIGRCAFTGCTLEEINIPSGVTRIEAHTFNGCDLKEIVIPEGVTFIGDRAFGGVPLRHLTVPKGVTERYRAFSRCRVEEAVISYDAGEKCSSAFWRCSKLKKVVFTDGVKRVDLREFDGCARLAEIVIPESVREIRGGFDRCEKAVAVVRPHSCAETYCRDNGLPYSFAPERP